MGKKRIQNDGFTLVELLIVVFIMSIIAGGAILMLDGQEEDAALKISHKEILDIKKAVLQFKQDTGYLPKQGPFALEPPGGFVAPPDGAVLRSSLPSSAAGQEQKWFDSPANFWQLYEQPQLDSGHPQSNLSQWSSDIARGWRGPYLTRFGEGVVDIGDNINPDENGSGGNPEQGILLLDIRGVADAFIAGRGACPTNNKGCYLGFSILPDEETHKNWGRPYLLFGLETTDTDDDWIVGMGPNKTYNQGNEDDIVIELFR